MARLTLLWGLLGVLVLPVWAQSPPDCTSVPVTVDTLFVIPAGPVAGSFTPAARLAVEDTVAGWARVRVEGWVPIRAILSRLQSVPADTVRAVKAAGGRCQALTTKGTPCKRKAKPGTRYCWQHQR